MQADRTHYSIFSDDDKKAFCTLGYTLYHMKQYDKAIKLFVLLSLYEPSNPNYYAAIAACDKMLKNYKQAIRHYRLASAVEFEEAKQIIFKLIECQIANGDIDPAIHALTHISTFNTRSSPAIDEAKRNADHWLSLLR